MDPPNTSDFRTRFKVLLILHIISDYSTIPPALYFKSECQRISLRRSGTPVLFPEKAIYLLKLFLSNEPFIPILWLLKYTQKSCKEVKSLLQLKTPFSFKRRYIMLETIAIILLVLWLLGLVTSYTMGGLIHGLLVIAIVIILIRVIQGRRI